MNKTSKRILCIAVVTLLITVALVGAGAADNPTGTKIDSVSGLTTFLSSSGTATGYLNTNITGITDTLTVNGTKTLDLNGYVIQLDSSKTGSVITVSSGAKLTLNDSNPTKKNYFNDSSSTTGLWVWAGSGATSGKHTVLGGCITGGTGNGKRGGGVLIEEGTSSGGTFCMNRGNIVGNITADGCGGGVSVGSDTDTAKYKGKATFMMNGGSILGNVAKHGGGVYVYPTGEFTMSDGAVISYNTASKAGGGVSDKGTFTMTGGEISYNTNTATDNPGGGVNVVNSTTSSFTMTGGIISYNTANTDGIGSGVYTGGPGSVTIGGTAKIINNTKSNLYLRNNEGTIGTIKIEGLTAGASIGVTHPSGTGVITSNGSNGDEKYFFCDDPSKYHIELVTNHLELKNTTVPVTGVSLNETSTTISVGTSETLIATVAPGTASDKRVTWSSSNTSVATVDENGKVTAVAAGGVTITCKSVADTTKSATCVVNPAASITTGTSPVTTYYETLNGAITAAGLISGDVTINILNNCTISNSVSKNITFANSGSAHTVTMGGDMAISGNLSIGQNLTLDVSTHKLTVSGTLSNGGTIKGSGTLDITGTINGNGAFTGFTGIIIANNGTLASNSSNLEYVMGKLSSNTCTVVVGKNATLTSDTAKTITMGTGNTLKIQGGATLTVDTKVTLKNSTNIIRYGDSGTATITVNGILDNTGATADPSNVTIDAVANIGKVYYGALDAALTAAGSGNTITILKSCDLSAVTISNNITFSAATDKKTVKLTGELGINTGCKLSIGDYVELAQNSNNITVNGTGSLVVTGTTSSSITGTSGTVTADAKITATTGGSLLGYYGSLNDAIDTAGTGNTVSLLKSCEITADTKEIVTGVILDVSDAMALTVNDGKKFTVSGGITLNGTGKIINNGTIEVKNNDVLDVILASGKIEIGDDSGVVQLNSGSEKEISVSLVVPEKLTLEILSSNTLKVPSDKKLTVNGTLKINGGTGGANAGILDISSNTGSGITANGSIDNAGTINVANATDLTTILEKVTSGKVTIDNATAAVAVGDDEVKGTTELHISSGKTLETTSGKTLTVTGTITADDTGAVITNNGTIIVKNPTTLNTVLDHVTTGTVKLGFPVTLDEKEYVVAGGVTLDHGSADNDITYGANSFINNGIMVVYDGTQMNGALGHTQKKDTENGKVKLGASFSTDTDTIKEGTTLIIPESMTLTVPEDKTLTVNGLLDVEGVLATNAKDTGTAEGIVELKSSNASITLADASKLANMGKIIANSADDLTTVARKQNAVGSQDDVPAVSHIELGQSLNCDSLLTIAEYVTVTVPATIQMTVSNGFVNNGTLDLKSADKTKKGLDITSGTASNNGIIIVNNVNDLDTAVTINPSQASNDTPVATVQLGGDIALTDKSLTVDTGKTVTLDLNGKKLSRNSESNFSVITVNGNLTLIDSSNPSAGTISGGNAANGGGVNVANGGAFTMTGGTITENTATTNGGGVYAGGTMTVGGTANITGNTGGNVYLPKDQTISLQTGFNGSASVTTAVTPYAGKPVYITSNYVDDAENKFTSDNSAYKVEKTGNCLALTSDDKETFTVTFDANGHGTAPKSQTVVDGDCVIEPDDPIAAGYIFSGWYTEAGCENLYDFSTPVTFSFTLYAKWLPYATVTISTNTVEFGTVKFDEQMTYTVPAEKSVTITNSTLADVGITESGTDDSFVITGLPSTLASGESVTFTVQPKSDLTEAKEYTHLITVVPSVELETSQNMSILVNFTLMEPVTPGKEEETIVPVDPVIRTIVDDNDKTVAVIVDTAKNDVEVKEGTGELKTIEVTAKDGAGKDKVTLVITNVYVTKTTAGTTATLTDASETTAKYKPLASDYEPTVGGSEDCSVMMKITNPDVDLMTFSGEYDEDIASVVNERGLEPVLMVTGKNDTTSAANLNVEKTTVAFDVEKSKIEGKYIYIVHVSGTDTELIKPDVDTSGEKAVVSTTYEGGFSSYVLAVSDTDPTVVSTGRSTVTSFTGEKSGNDFTFSKAVVVTKATLPNASSARITNTSGDGWYNFKLEAPDTDGNGTVYFQVPTDVISVKNKTVNDVSLVGYTTKYLTTENGYAKYSAIIPGEGTYKIDFVEGASSEVSSSSTSVTEKTVIEEKKTEEITPTEKKTETQKTTTETKTTQTTKSPVPIIGILAGLGATILFLKRRL